MKIPSVEKIGDILGITGPIILFFYALYALQKYPPYLSVFVPGFLANVLINLIIKRIVREPKPMRNFDDTIVLDSYYQHEWLIWLERTNEYGMPSMFVQSACFITAFLYQVLCSFKVLFFTSMIVLLTVYYQYKYRIHTVFQILAGMGLGSLLGILTFTAIYHTLHKPIFGEPE